MRLIGIDYGDKRVGIASTDESGEFALPRAVLPNDEHLVGEVLKMIKAEGVEAVVIGDSKNYAGKENPIMEKTRSFASELEVEGVKVFFHPEVLSSMEADRLQGQNAMRDASAAAIILKSYIDSNK